MKLHLSGKRKMRTLKEDIKFDNQEVFFDLGEFAEYVEIDGMILEAQVQYRTEKASSLKSESFETLHGDYTKIFFRTADYCRKNERIPVEGEFVHINGKRYKVLTSKDEIGITRLAVSSYRQEQLRQKQFQRMELGGLDDNY